MDGFAVLLLRECVLDHAATGDGDDERSDPSTALVQSAKVQRRSHAETTEAGGGAPPQAMHKEKSTDKSGRPASAEALETQTCTHGPRMQANTGHMHAECSPGKVS